MNRAAGALAARGLAKGDRLALLAHNSWSFAVLVFATAKLGVVLVPINFMLNADEIALHPRPLRALPAMVADDALLATAEKAIGDAVTALRSAAGSAGDRRRAGRTCTTGGARARPTTPRSRWPTTTRCG